MQRPSYALITGASGFFGGILKRKLLRGGQHVLNIDLVRDHDTDPALVSVQGDLRDAGLVRKLFADFPVHAVYHCAAQMAHGELDRDLLWTSNVDATRVLCEEACRAGVRWPP